MKSTERPSVGDRITHHLPHLDVTRAGVVCWLLTSSFAYETEDGQTWLVQYNEDWNYADRRH